MTRPIETVLAEALKRLETNGRLDIAAYAAAYPEHADQLRDLLPAMLTLHEERRWQQVEQRANGFALSLFPRVVQVESARTAAAPAPYAVQTLGDLFTSHRNLAGLSLEEQARQSGLSPEVLETLSRDQTPVSGLDNSGIKSLASKIAAPFAGLVKEIRRLTSLTSLTQGQAVFTRDSETSTAQEQQALIDLVTEATTKPQSKTDRPAAKPDREKE